MEQKSCLIMGDINIDFAIHAKAYPPEGGEAHAQQADFRLGGSGCLTAMALQLNGYPTSLAGNLGQDVFAQFAWQHIQQCGLDHHLVRQLPDQQTGFFMILVTPGGQRTMFGNRAANAQLLPEADIMAFLPACSHVHLSGYILLVEEQYRSICRILPKAKSLGLSVSLDPGVCTSQNARSQVLQLLPFTDFCLLSRDELDLLAGNLPLDQQAKTLLALGCPNIVIKLGEQGSRWISRDQDICQHAMQESGKVVRDTTGAGDCFNAGFLNSILSGAPAQQALQNGNGLAYRIITSAHGVLDLMSTAS